jgi:predicted RecA/RadA family phage recombinase
MGGVAAINTDGMAVPYSATASTPVGIFVNPNEHVKMVLPSSERSLVVKAGDTVAIAKKGSWYVAVPEGDAANWVKGAKIAYDSSAYGLKVDASGTVAEILGVDGGIALIRFL